MKKDKLYQVIDNHGECLTTGTYMECMAFIQEPSQIKKNLTVDRNIVLLENQK